MDKDDDDADDAIGIGRYPVMPSLVALQQMKNRLQLATLGKKLMKWSALATGRELRKLSMAIQENYEDYDALVANAYIKLARSRYYYQNLNEMIIENLHSAAECTLFSEVRAVAAGVRVLQYDIIEDHENIHYQYLGMEKGGETIKSAKQAWLTLIKRMVLLTQLRSSFEAVGYANSSAVKRQNVLGKVVIPRTNATIKYILLELEESAREEKFRVKKIVEVKKKRRIKADEHLEQHYERRRIAQQPREEPPPPPKEIEPFKETIPTEPSLEIEPFKESIPSLEEIPEPPPPPPPPPPQPAPPPPQPIIQDVPPQPLIEDVPPQPLMEDVPPQPLTEDVPPQPIIEDIPPQPIIEEIPPQQKPPPSPLPPPVPPPVPPPPQMKRCVLCGAPQPPGIELIPNCGLKSLQLIPGMEMMVPLPPCSIIRIQVSTPCLHEGKVTKSEKAELIFKTMVICPECHKTPSSDQHDSENPLPPIKSVSGQTYVCGCPDNVNTAGVAGDSSVENAGKEPSESKDTYTGGDTSLFHEEFESRIALCEITECLIKPVEEKHKPPNCYTFSEPVGSCHLYPQKSSENCDCGKDSSASSKPSEQSWYETNKSCHLYPKKSTENCDCGNVFSASSKPSEIKCICASRFESKESYEMPSHEASDVKKSVRNIVDRIVGVSTNVASTSSPKNRIPTNTTADKRVSYGLTQTDSIKCKDVVHRIPKNICHDDCFITDLLNEILDALICREIVQNSCYYRSQQLSEVDWGRKYCPKVESKTRIRQFRTGGNLSSSEIKRIEKTINIKRSFYADGSIDEKENVKVIIKRRLLPCELNVVEQASKSSHETEYENRRAISSCCFIHEPRFCGDNIETSQTHAFHNPQFNEPILRNCVSDIYPKVKNKKHYKVEGICRESTKCFIPKSESFRIAQKCLGAKNLLKNKKPSDHAQTPACVKETACIPVAQLSCLSTDSLCCNFDQSEASNVLLSVESIYTTIDTEGQISTTSKSMTSEFSRSLGCSDCSDTNLVNLKADRQKLVKIVRVCINELEQLGKTNNRPLFLEKNNCSCNESDQNESRCDTLNGRDICKHCLLKLSGLTPNERIKFSKKCKLCQMKKSK